MSGDKSPSHLPAEAGSELISQRRYRKLLVSAVTGVSVVAIVPLLVMTFINYHQYQEAFQAEATRPIARLTASGQQSLESFLSERLSALSIVVRERSYRELSDSRKLNRLLVNMKQAFRGFVDLGVIDQAGLQLAYAGPYDLEGKSYAQHDWFHEVSMRGVYISDVFMGHRNVPHFVLAVRHDTQEGDQFVLRATIDTDVINRLVRSLAVQRSGDAFLINQNGVLQTPSRLYGKVLERCPLPQLHGGEQPEIIELKDERGESLVVGLARVERSPFTVVLLSHKAAVHARWASLRSKLLLFLLISILLILAVVWWGSRYMVTRMREADIKRATLYHKMEYTNKMAAIGRLGAGVAHEINNPLSIITEKAGLLKDLLLLSKEDPPREKLVELINSVLKSADRCGTITHRLLGFAKHMEIQRDIINLEMLLKEVLGFLEKEASYRGIRVEMNCDQNTPRIVSDRGQLQQVFLNIINNAFAAVDDGGLIKIDIAGDAEGSVSVRIADNGMGIAEEHLSRIFDPFFTTKKGAGTGLGLSITYGIVQKLGGQITVTSQLGQGTCFTVLLPAGQEEYS
jgi:signal transduction histidine kinase